MKHKAAIQTQDFRAKKGARISDRQAQKYGPEIIRLCQKLGDSVTPEEIVRHSKSKKSVLNEYFQWDDKAAANAYRLHQARLLQTGIEAKFSLGDGSEIWAPLTGNIKVFLEKPEPVSEDNHPEQVNVYIPTSTISRNPMMQKQVFDDAISDIRAATKRIMIHASLSGSATKKDAANSLESHIEEGIARFQEILASSKSKSA